MFGVHHAVGIQEMKHLQVVTRELQHVLHAQVQVLLELFHHHVSMENTLPIVIAHMDIQANMIKTLHKSIWSV